VDLGSVRPSLCAAVEGGPVFASGVDFEGAESQTRLWLGGGLLGRARWSVAGPAFAELEARAMFPFVRDRYFYRPDTTIYEVPAVTVAGAAAVGLRFP
jgi:hypothetical protein